MIISRGKIERVIINRNKSYIPNQTRFFSGRAATGNIHLGKREGISAPVAVESCWGGSLVSILRDPKLPLIRRRDKELALNICLGAWWASTRTAKLEWRRSRWHPA
jgi:hypothetical protein